MWTKEASKMSQPMISKDTPNATSSPESEAGPTLSTSPDGETAHAGQDRHHASHSAEREKSKAWMMPVTYGPLFGGSSASAALQSSLASRLQARIPWNGLTVLGMKWKALDMPSGRQVCLLAVSDYISGEGAGILLPTPRASKRGPRNPASAAKACAKRSKNAMNRIEEYLCMRAGKTGYPNPEYLLWLMGFPASWMRSLERATQSAHRSQ